MKWKSKEGNRNMNFDSKKIGSNEFFDPSKSLCIEASAGTGKTYTIQQIVARLLNDGTPLEKILIVTYTEKAAGELKDRIRKKIEEVIDSGKLNKDNTEDVEYNRVKDVQKFIDALREVDNAPIFTIHSFCQKTLRENAYDAGRPFDMAMIDENFVEGIVAEWSREKWLEDSAFSILLDNCGKAQNFLKDLSTKLCNAINTYKGLSSEGSEIITINHVDTYGFDVPPTNFEELSRSEGVKENLNVMREHKDCCFTQKKDSKTLGDFVEAIEKWDSGTLYDGSSFKDGNTPKKWPADAYNAFKYFYELKSFLGRAFDAFTNKFINSQIPELFEKWQAYKLAHKCQSYNDMILSVHKAVMAKGDNGADSELCKKLRQQYNFAIIDEFQDTNQLQWDIFSKLFNPIFVVGDPKQSIYSFQGADVTVYQKATDAIKNRGKQSSLVNNFRSTKSIIEGCNHLFEKIEGEDFFAPNDKDAKASITFSDSSFPEGADKKEPTFNGNPQKAFIVSEADCDETEFAQAAVKKIVEFCSFTESVDDAGKKQMKTALQVFDKEHPNALKNVTFRDFAILARTRSEMEIIEDAMRSAGVPFTRYKDTNLFNGRECSEWIALFKAIDATDFSARNRRILNEALITDFFRVNLEDVEKDLFDNPSNPARIRIMEWKQLAQKRRFAEMQERIYENTQIEKRLMDLSMLQNLAKLRQIGNYCISFLYQNNACLGDLIRHLENLRNDDADTDDEDGNLVAKGTDFDAVQVMTIHASKGLEFPVVISVAGFKQFNTHTSGPYIYHEGESTQMGFEPHDKDVRKAEEMEEWKRLFYVNFTRASSILILPRYKKWHKEGGKTKEEFTFLAKAMDNFCDKHSEYIETLLNEPWDEAKAQKIRNEVKQKILKPLNEAADNDAEATSISSAAGIATENAAGIATRETQEQAAADLQKKMAGLSILQFSYSTLAGKADDNVSESGFDRADKEGSEAESSAVQDSAQEASRIKYPKGNKLGNALHSIFEELKFFEFGQVVKSLESAKNHAQLVNKIEEHFKKQGLPLWKHKKEWSDYTAEIVWNTLHAKFPAISAANRTGETFELVDIPTNCKKAECQFNMNATLAECGAGSEVLQRMFKGFIDLLFVRTEKDGNKRYCILDWKSDLLENDIYSAEAVKNKVDEDYSIQRVLYSYCLVKWLEQFYPGVSDAEIFEKHFGGIYYVFLRGTREGSDSGIYSHTWENFESLQNAFGKIKSLMAKKKISSEDAENGEDA
ncbi:UvrD-helicase domain-containing protein [Fibrobacter sp.]|uniref:UvrD-helicase domain-containing protein n=1 Tax=Fibrobacter sp. TaxID=35828 RepID=UPI00388FFB96